MAEEEVGQHDAGGEEISGQDAPPGERGEQRRSVEHDKRQEEHLEAGEEHDECHDEARLALRAGLLEQSSYPSTSSTARRAWCSEAVAAPPRRIGLL
jgi:hypothetical protein